ncbi:MAG: hypothetical protein NTW21_44540, partial [Verrucomicrobia bacterium]|nr:hypothetical protein [Verrucomicrobiota bacterium]
MNIPTTINHLRSPIRGLALASAASVAVLLAMQSARAQTTIPAGTTVTVTDPNTYFGAAGDLTLENDVTLNTTPSSQGTYSIANALIFAGTGGTYHLRFNDNDTLFTFNGAITSTASGAQTLAITTGCNGNGDREEVTFASGIPDVGSASAALGLNVTFNTQSSSYSFVNLPGNNTFTGPITLVKGANVTNGYLTIGGRGIGFNGNQYAVTNGSGSLATDYPGAISLGAATILSYASSAPQNLAGAISGAGAVQTTGAGTLTLSGLNTYAGNTTVNSGSTLDLAQTGGLTLYVTNASNSKITGGGTANLDGTFTIDTSAVSAPIASWTLVNVTNKTYGSNFNVPGFDGSGGVWTKVLGSATWTFTEATGVLSINTLATITSFGIPGHAGVIDNVALTISLFVPYATDLATLAPTFTVTSGIVTANDNAVSSGSAPTPTFAVTNPATYTATDGDAVSPYTVTVVVAPAPPAGLGEADGLVAWYDASQLTGLSDGNSVDTWADLSGYGHIATRTAGTMSYATNQVNSLPTVQFRGAGYANISGTMFAKEQYIVFKSPSGNSYNGDWGAVLGDVTDQYGYMMGDGTRFWNGNYPVAVSQNGTVLASPWNITNMGSFLILKIVGTYPDANLRNYSLGNVFGNGSPQYHNVNLDVAEIIAYDHVLSTGAAEQLGSYLTIKYGLSTNYAGLGDIVTFGIPGYPATINRIDKTIALTVPWVPWGTTGLSTLNPTFALSSGTCDQTSGAPPAPYIFGGPDPVTYTVTDGSIVNTYTVTVNVQPPAPGGVGSGLALWLDASASDTMTLSDATVTEWRDKMLSGAKMTTKGGAPTLTPSG